MIPGSDSENAALDRAGLVNVAVPSVLFPAKPAAVLEHPSPERCHSVYRPWDQLMMAVLFSTLECETLVCVERSLAARVVGPVAVRAG